MKELTSAQRRELRSLVLNLCANYEKKYCLVNNKECPVLEMGPMCRYFEKSVLPNNPRLAAALTSAPVVFRNCAACGKQYIPTGRQAYCSDSCQQKGNRDRSRERMRKQRG